MPKTKSLLQKLAAMDIEGSVLIVSHEPDENLFLSARNVHTIDILDTEIADPVSLFFFFLRIILRLVVRVPEPRRIALMYVVVVLNHSVRKVLVVREQGHHAALYGAVVVQPLPPDRRIILKK